MLPSMLRISLLAVAAAAASVAHSRDTAANVVQFRIYGQGGCDQQNEGFFTFLAEDVGGCKNFSFYQATVESFILQQLSSDYKIKFWTEEDCSGAATAYDAAPNTCTAQREKSFKISKK